MFTILGRNIYSIFKSLELCKLFKILFYFDQLVEMHLWWIASQYNKKTLKSPASSLHFSQMWYSPNIFIIKTDTTTATSGSSIILQCTDIAANAVRSWEPYYSVKNYVLWRQEAHQQIIHMCSLSPSASLSVCVYIISQE